MHGKLAVALAPLAGLLLAGCGSDGASGEEADPATGSARILVVDEAVRPLAQVGVALSRPGTEPLLNVTDEDGIAIFSGLEPGAYVAEATLRGYDPFQVALTVTAGEHEPPFTRLALSQQAGGLAFHDEIKIDGYMELSASIGNWGIIANYYPCFVMTTAGQPCFGNLTNDRSLMEVRSLHERQRIPDWVQLEMVWDSTQAVSEYLFTRMDLSLPGQPLIDNATGATGPSPLLVVYPPEWFTAWGLGVNHTLVLEAFHGGPEALCDADPTELRTCRFVGVAAQQRFTWFLHVFYGHVPPEGWRFTADGPPPPA